MPREIGKFHTEASRNEDDYVIVYDDMTYRYNTSHKNYKNSKFRLLDRGVNVTHHHVDESEQEPQDLDASDFSEKLRRVWNDYLIEGILLLDSETKDTNKGDN